ncbi:chorismate-binding protein [Staphylococcus caeli]|uniref:chorismate-binding protein n=1 Tax=Staphylococcus caeli TaxID=2201815 RepID=UPI003F5568BF
MPIHFNYRYYLDETTYENHQYYLTECVERKVAYCIQDVGDVVAFAEQQQHKGKYVALYLPYEAATYFNPEMVTVSIEHQNVFAAAYVFDHVDKDITVPFTQRHQRHCQFHFQVKTSQLKEHIRAIQAAIIEGNTYQVNYTTRLTDVIRYSIAELYYSLLQQNHGFYTALIDMEEVQIASLSPELFFQRGPFKDQADILLSKPMKGTIARGQSEQEDEQNFKTLRQSAKDRAENVMIVDLLRNDLSRIAQTGTVKVYQPFHIETYETVFQMTSMVTGAVNQTTRLTEVLAALFPCGSITGAPKINTMKYIQALEQVPRYAYCGTIGLLIPNGKAIFNVPIRTIQYINEQAVYGVGAGITIDSIPEQEVQEFFDKTKILERL